MAAAKSLAHVAAVPGAPETQGVGVGLAAAGEALATPVGPQAVRVMARTIKSARLAPMVGIRSVGTICRMLQ
jgi:hypothetical protein